MLWRSKVLKIHNINFLYICISQVMLYVMLIISAKNCKFSHYASVFIILSVFSAVTFRLINYMSCKWRKHIFTNIICTKFKSTWTAALLVWLERNIWNFDFLQLLVACNGDPIVAESYFGLEPITFQVSLLFWLLG